MPDIRLDGLFTLRAPMSHIGETISNQTFLVEDQILQPDGSTEPVFAYSGNAWRGQLRDLMAAYMLDKLGQPPVTLDSFHLLFSGGRIGGAQSIDLEQGRRMRSAIPMLALLGGGVGNQILEGKLRFGTSYPLCREAMPVLPRRLHAEASQIGYATLTMDKEHSRRDDAKVDSIAAYLPPANTAALPPTGRKKPRDEDVPTQMRMRSELVVPGTKLRTWIAGRVSEVELGCLVSGLHRFAQRPMIGGQGARGHGLVDLDYAITDLETGETDAFLTVEDGVPALSDAASAAKASYDAHLKRLYDDVLAEKGGEITKLLGAA